MDFALDTQNFIVLPNFELIETIFWWKSICKEIKVILTEQYPLPRLLLGYYPLRVMQSTKIMFFLRLA